MVNEFIFLIQIFTIIGFAFASFLLGAYALTAFVCLAAIFANIFVLKQITLFGLTVTCSDAFAVGSMIGLNLLQENFGKAQARKALMINFVGLLFFAIFAWIHLQFNPSIIDSSHVHYLAILGWTPRIIAASFLAYVVSQTADYFLYGLFNRLTKGKYLLVRNYSTLAISQFVDTLTFSVLGLWGIVGSVIHIIFFSYTIKLITIALAAPIAVLCKKIARLN